MIIGAALTGYVVAHAVTLDGRPCPGSWCCTVMTGLGLVGFLDDFIKISKQRSLGLRAGGKLAGQSFVSISFAVLTLQFPDSGFRTPGSTAISFIRDTAVDLAFAGP